ncbi:MAG: hypothetical protein P8J32_03055 [bacterium]|nr:hypothetical protein [bacterium]
MKIRRMAFSHLSSILEIQGFGYPVLEKRVGENTLEVRPINGETQRAIQVREFVPITYDFQMPEDLYESDYFEQQTTVRKGRAIKDFTLHIDA